jgi:hemolysin III
MSASAAAPPHVSPRVYSTAEERLHCLSHGVGALGSLVGMAFLLPAAARHGTASLVACAVYGATLLLMFTSSTAYHAVPLSNAPLKRRLRALDHATIFLLIAGTYTAFASSLLGGWVGHAVLASMWALCGLGIYGVWRRGTKQHGPIVPSLAMGTLVVLTVPQLGHSLAPAGIALFVGGAAIYALGIPFYVLRRWPHHHGIWHAFVLAASMTHFYTISVFVVP